MSTPTEKHAARMAHRAAMIDARKRLKGANADYAAANGWASRETSPGPGSGGTRK